MHDLEGRTVLITGASGGIGAAAADAFAAAGANVVLLARREERIAEIAGRIGPDRALAVPCDVSRFWEVEAAAHAAVSAFGGLDIVVNNAGTIEPIARLDEVDPMAWSQAIDVNLKGVFHGIRAALPLMLQAGGGTILNISSGAASGPNEGWSQYCAAKAGAAMLLRCVHREFGERGIRAIGLSPGTVATDMQRQIKASGINRVSRLDWSDHISPDWPARALVWLAGPEGDAFVGEEVSLRDEDIRRRVGLA
jgi:NAD(P)-dependent dehydrogenase (short-subunit alcohol dehydrogenase family)